MIVKWNTRQVGDVTVVDAPGRITTDGGSLSLRDTVAGLAAGGRKNVVINLAQTAYMDSSGIGELVAALSAVSKQGGSLKLLALQKRIQDLLRMTKVNTLFQVFDDEAAAVNSFSKA